MTAEEMFRIVEQRHEIYKHYLSVEGIEMSDEVYFSTLGKVCALSYLLAELRQALDVEE